MNVKDLALDLETRINTVCNAQKRYRVLWIVGDGRLIFATDIVRPNTGSAMADAREHEQAIEVLYVVELAVAISLIASVSVECCTTAISRDRRSSAAS